MKHFYAPFISGEIADTALSHASKLFSKDEKQHIDNLLWSDSGYMPVVDFNMAYTNSGILLNYVVKERNIRAVYRQVNNPVYKDTCVEAFIAFNNESSYYNLEFNCLGTALVGFGSGKDDRIDISKHLVEKIKSYHLIKSPTEEDSLIEWELTLNIPFAVFEHHHITSLNEQTVRANFYKCGDDLPEPHFLSWNNIIHSYPDFHLPEFFGEVKFAN